MTAGGQASAAPSQAAVSYRPPVITALSGPGAAGAVTPGSQTVYVTGDMFGPATLASPAGVPQPGAIAPLARYGHPAANASLLQYLAQGCLVTVDHTQMTCLTAPGTGAALVWAAFVAGQVSAISTATSSYAPPIFGAYSGPGSHLANTTGG